MIATMASKGQVTVPREIREHFHIKTGDKLDFVINDDNTLVIVPLLSSIKSLRGVLSSPGNPVTLEDMKRAIGTGRNKIFLNY